MTPNPLRWSDFFAKEYGSTSVRITPFDLADPRGFNLYLDQYVAIVRQVGAEEELVLIDVHQAFEDYGRVKGQQVEDLLLDGVHPNKGHRIIADLLASKIVKLSLTGPK
jgi:lysophospholipase L1-like esterase